MGQVLLNSLLMIGALALLCIVLVKSRAGSLRSLKSALTSFSRTSAQGQDAMISVRQRVYLGWKSSMVDVCWQHKRYLLVLQEGRCTVVDCTDSEPSLNRQDVNNE